MLKPEYITRFIDLGVIPDESYYAAERFTSHYKNTAEFYTGISLIFSLPLVNAVNALYSVYNAVWAALRVQ